MSDGPSPDEIAANEKLWMTRLAGDWFDQERQRLIKVALIAYQSQELSADKALQLLADLNALAKLEKKVAR